MQSNTKFLPGFSTKLHGRQRRRQLESFRIKRERLRSESVSDFGTLFDSILPLEKLFEFSESLRNRIFPEVVTFWAWVSQIVEANSSCAKATALVQAWHEEAKLPLPAANTSSFCRARQRLSESFLNAVDEMCQDYAEARVEEHHRWRGLRLKAIDGTSFRLMDTPDNQVDFPQSSSQAPGCGFPLMGAVGVLDLATGRIERTVTGRDRKHDARGLYELAKGFTVDDIVLADRAFCSFELIALLRRDGVESVMRLHQRREGKLDWRRGRMLDAHSRLVTWAKPPKPGACGITREEWKALPEEMQIRLVRIRAAGRDGKPRTIYLATTLIDAEKYPTDEVAALYAERWKIEVKFRDIKTTLRLDMLRVKTPEMARKTLRMIQITYNLIKSLQHNAIQNADLVIDEIGFKGTVDVLSAFRTEFQGLQNRPRLLKKMRLTLDERILERWLRIRPHRSEPRAVKRRPQHLQWMTKPRSEFIEIQHRSKYYAIA